MMGAVLFWLRICQNGDHTVEGSKARWTLGGWLVASCCITFTSDHIPSPGSPQWSPDSPGTPATDWNLLDSHTRKTVKTSPFVPSNYCLIPVCGGPIHIFQNGLHSMLTVLLPLLPFSLNNGSPQILWILRKKLWILCCQFAFFASSFKFTLNWIFWQICNSSFQIRLKRKIWKMLAEDFIIKLVWKN